MTWGRTWTIHGASCLRGPCEPGMLADVVGRVVPRPAVESVCKSGSKRPTARYTERDGAIQLLPLLEEALMAVETRARATSERRRNGATVVLEPLREQAQMAVALEPLLDEALTTGISRGSERRAMEGASETRGGRWCWSLCGKGLGRRWEQVADLVRHVVELPME